VRASLSLSDLRFLSACVSLSVSDSLSLSLLSHTLWFCLPLPESLPFFFVPSLSLRVHVCVCVLACVCLSICVCMCTCVRATNKRSKVEKFGVHRFESPPRRPVTDQSPSRRAQSPDRRNPESPARGGRAPSHHDHAGRDASPVRSGHGGRRSSSPDIGHRSSSPTAGARRPSSSSRPSSHHGMQALALVGVTFASLHSIPHTLSRTCKCLSACIRQSLHGACVYFGVRGYSPDELIFVHPTSFPSDPRQDHYHAFTSQPAST